MADVIAFRPRQPADEETQEIDLLTAVDAAIRDLRDICRDSVEGRVREQANACREMLERAFQATVG
jgi:hypothetical protein